MTGTHTPGPWRIEGDELGGRGQVGIRAANGNWVAGADAQDSIKAGFGEAADHKSHTEAGQPEAWANARLIASAPDLLRERDALRDALGNMTSVLAGVAALDWPREVVTGAIRDARALLDSGAVPAQVWACKSGPGCWKKSGKHLTMADAVQCAALWDK